MWKNMVKLDRPRITIRYDTEKILFACWITEVRIETYVYSIQYSLLLHGKNSCANAPQYYVMLTLPVLFRLKMV
jgi:hypothetical protein